MIPDAIRRIAADGIEFPARAIVRSSRADSQYTATVEVLDAVGEPAGQMLTDVPLDPLWLSAGGKGVWAPPDVDQVVAVVWMGGIAGHPVITSGALLQPAAPRNAVPGGQWSVQGDTWDMRMRPGEWVLFDAAGAVLSASGSRFKVAADDDLLAILDAWLDALIAAQTVVDTDTASGGAGRNLPFDGGTVAALTAIKARLPLVLRS